MEDDRSTLTAAAAGSALALPEIVVAVLAHLQPPRFQDEHDVSGDHHAAASHEQLRAGNAAACENRNALRAAALVNRAWFAAAASLLWRCPSPNALAADAVATLERRDFYMNLIREVRLSQRCPLWRALADADENNDGSGLPQLSALRLDIGWEVLSGSNWSRQIEAEQAPLIRYINLDLEELEATVSAALVDRLILLTEAVPEQKGMDPTYAQVTGPSHLARPDTQGRHDTLRRLRKLVLIEEWPITSDVASETERRLLAWLTQQPCVTPALSCVRLKQTFCSKRGRTNRVFRHFAYHEGLKQLWLSNNLYSYHGVVSSAAIEDVRATSTSSGDDGRLRDEADCSRFADHHRGHTRRRLPFVQLKELKISVWTSGLPTLALLLPSLTSLDANVWNDLEDSDTVKKVARFFPVIATALPHLRKLSLHLKQGIKVLWEDMLALQQLTQLRELAVAGGSIDGAVDTDLGVLLRPLSHLQDLFLGMDMSWSPPERQLRSLADARPSLRSLRLTGTYYLAPLLDDPPHTPAFPVLERLRATHFDMLHSSGTSDASIEKEAQRQAHLLGLQLPCLYDLCADDQESIFEEHLISIFDELINDDDYDHDGDDYGDSDDSSDDED